jgi:hypothetical protein
MAKRKKEDSREYVMDLARSWKGKFIRDAYERQLGFVYDIDASEELPRLVARFPDGDRIINLVPTDDLNYTAPGHVRARYRPPTEEDLARIDAARRRA